VEGAGNLKPILFIVGIIASLLPLANAQAQADDCTYIVEDNVIPLYSAPLNIASLQVDVLPVGSTYTVEKRAERYLYLSSGGIAGWIHGLSLGGRTEGDCTSLPEDDRPLTDYPTVCFFIPIEAMHVYNDSSLTDEHDAFDLKGGESYPVVYADEASLFAYIDDAAGGWVSAETGFVSGLCDDLAKPDGYQQAIALENARLWSQPNVRIGAIVADVEPETPLHIISGPVLGSIRLDTEDLGKWFYVSDGTQAGWLWEARVEFEEVDGDDVDTTVKALEDTRLWSLPNVQQGSLIAFVNPGSTVRILEGPVNGPIRFDTTDIGGWYFVEVGTTRGWVWEDRLDFGS
jgi:hypothetical protein